MTKLIFLSFMLFSFSALAQINFNNVTHSGTGCPQGTVSTLVSPDGTSLSILFDEFRAQVPDYTQINPRTRAAGTLSHKNCAISFIASLPAGVKADSLEISISARGATMLDQGVEASFAAILVGYSGLARSRGAPTVISAKKWRGLTATDESWLETPRALVPLMSGCSGAQGRDIRFDLKNHVIAEITNGNTSKSGLITVDSNDVNGLVKLTLRTSPCGPRGVRMAP